jgi:hypothetical protein
MERLGSTSGEVRAAVLLDESGELVGHVGDDGASPEDLRELARGLFAAAELSGARAGVERVERVEVSRPEGGVFGVRDPEREGGSLTLVAVADAGALSSLVLYDMVMTLRGVGRDPVSTEHGAGG